MFLKTNQGLGRTYRNKKMTKEQKQNQTKPNQKEEEEEEKKSHTSKDLALVLMVVYAKRRKVGELPTFHQFLTVVASVLN